MKKTKLSKKKQIQLQKISNIIAIIGMLIVPYVINNIKIEDNQIAFKTDNINIIEGHIELFDIVIVGEINEDIPQEQIISIFENNSKTKIISIIELSLIFTIIIMFIAIFLLSYIETLFNNIKEEKTPFTLENVRLIKKISYFLIAITLISPLPLVMFELISVQRSETIIETFSIIEILIIYSMSYIFEYGYEIQKDSEGKIYS